jgi:hypothetical protein
LKLPIVIKLLMMRASLGNHLYIQIRLLADPELSSDGNMASMGSNGDQLKLPANRPN